MGSPLDDLAFLTRSPHRPRTLEALADEPRDRAALAGATGASQPTLGRVLSAFEERGWITADEDAYRITPAGELVVAGLREAEDALSTAAKLGEVADRLPVETFDFDLSALADAEIFVPSPTDPLAPTRRAAAQVRDADRVRALTQAVAPSSVEAFADGAGEQTVEVIIPSSAFDVLAADPEFSAKLRTLLDGGTATVRVVESVPYVFAICDEIVGIGVPGEDGTPAAVIESGDEAVVEWAERTFEEYRTGGRRVGVDELLGQGR